MTSPKFHPHSEQHKRTGEDLLETEARFPDAEDEPLLPLPTAEDGPTWHSSNLRIYIVLFFMLIAANLSLQVIIPAQTRIFESIFCRQWYSEHEDVFLRTLPNGSIEERLCKIPAVQRDVNHLRALMEWWDALPGLFLVIPFGILADQVGRRWVLRLSISVILFRELWITFVSAVGIPLGAVYFGSALNIFSGGNAVAEMMFCVIITDITPRQKLPNIFFQLNAVGQFTNVVGPAIAGGLMRLNPWYPVLLGIILLFVSSSLSFLVPETLKSVDHHHHDTPIDHSQTGPPSMATLVKTAWSLYLKSLKELALIWADWRLIFLACLYPFRMLTAALNELFQRYVSLRYDWTLGDATFLYSMQACVAAALLLFVLPWISTTIDHKFSLSAIKKNVILAQYSLALAALGFFIIGIAPTVQLVILGLAIQALGSGASPSLRALAGVLVKQEDNGRVFSGLAISETLSIMVAYPVSAALFNRGIEQGGGMWLGLPFFVTAIAVAVVTLIMCFLHFERNVEHNAEDTSALLVDVDGR